MSATNAETPTFLLPAALVLGLSACTSTGAGAPLSATGDGTWSVVADVAESCCCDAICPCMVGSPATRGHCEGTRLIDIRHGHFGGVALDDVSVLATFRMGEWVKLYVSDDARPDQADAAARLIAAALPSFASWGIVSTERVPVAIERTPTSLVFSAPASRVEMDVMTGRAGEAIRVDNLAGFPDYVQYKSRLNRHKGGEQAFEYSGTSGFTARFEAAD